METEKIEKLADYAHNAWSRWMTYLFDKSIKNSDGTVLIPKSFVDRWNRQMYTLYSDLPQNEKESDRKEAITILNTIK